MPGILAFVDTKGEVRRKHAEGRIMWSEFVGVANRPASHVHSAARNMNSFSESQRDSGSKPRVASRELPWVNCAARPKPQRGCVCRPPQMAATPLTDRKSTRLNSSHLGIS